jgi:hypothetical protein
MNAAIPSLERLRAVACDRFWLVDARGRRWPALLHRAQSGVAMNTRYCCYSAQFAMPDGVQLPQDVYELLAAETGERWSLLLAPVGPRAEDGRALMEAVIHCLVAPD